MPRPVPNPVAVEMARAFREEARALEAQARDLRRVAQILDGKGHPMKPGTSRVEPIRR